MDCDPRRSFIDSTGCSRFHVIFLFFYTLYLTHFKPYVVSNVYNLFWFVFSAKLTKSLNSTNSATSIACTNTTNRRYSLGPSHSSTIRSTAPRQIRRRRSRRPSPLMLNRWPIIIISPKPNRWPSRHHRRPTNGRKPFYASWTP